MRIDRAADALLVVDLQHDFLPGGALAVDDGDAVVAPIASLASLRDGRASARRTGALARPLRPRDGGSGAPPRPAGRRRDARPQEGNAPGRRLVQRVPGERRPRRPPSDDGARRLAEGPRRQARLPVRSRPRFLRSGERGGRRRRRARGDRSRRPHAPGLPRATRRDRSRPRRGGRAGGAQRGSRALAPRFAPGPARREIRGAMRTLVYEGPGRVRVRLREVRPPAARVRQHGGTLDVARKTGRSGLERR